MKYIQVNIELKTATLHTKFSASKLTNSWIMKAIVVSLALNI